MNWYFNLVYKYPSYIYTYTPIIEMFVINTLGIING